MATPDSTSSSKRGGTDHGSSDHGSAERGGAEHAGYVVFPRSTAELRSTTICPACFAPLTSTTCTNCLLDVTHPAAAELHDTAVAAAAQLDHRVELIGRMRFEPAAAVAPTAAVPAVLAPPIPTPASVAPTTVAAPPAATSPTSPIEPIAPAAPRRHLGVQAILLIVGVALLAIGAIFFLVYAFITFGLAWRSVIIGAVTVASFVGASLLRRRKLGATAEAIAALAVVFVYLDVFAIRANELAGAQHVDGRAYWGIALVLSAVGFAFWYRRSGIRLPNVVAFTAFPIGVALVVAGVSAASDLVTAFAAFAGLTLAGLIHPLSGPRMPERIISQALGTTGLLAAGIAALSVEPETDWAPAVTLGIVALLAVAHVVVVARVGSVRVLGLIAAGIGAVAASAALLVVGVRLNDYSFVLLTPSIAAAVIALLLEFAVGRLAAFPRTAATVGAWAATVVTGLALLFPLASSFGLVGVRLTQAAHRWSISGGDTRYISDESRNSLICLAVVIVLAAVAWLLSRRFASRKPVIVWAGYGFLILAAPLLAILWLTVLAWLLLGAAGVVALVIAARRGSLLGVRAPLAIGAIIATTFAYSTSWASIDTWWFGSIGAVLVLVGARAVTTSGPVRALLIAAATVLAFVAIGSEGWHVNERFQNGNGTAVDANHFVLALAIALLVVSALIARRLSRLETRVLFWLPFGTAIVTVALGWWYVATGSPRIPGSLVLPEFGTSVVLAATLLGALLLWALLPQTAGFRVERFAASLAVTPVAAWLAESSTSALGLTPLAHVLAPLAAAVVVAAVSLALATRRAGFARLALDLGVALVVAWSVLTWPTADSWLTLLLGGVAVLLLAVSSDGLFGSTSPRKHLGWLALALTTAGLWWRLGSDRVHDLEPYVLPLAGALLIIAALAWRAARPQPSLAAPGILLAGLAVGLLPLAVVGAHGTIVRAIVVGAVAAVLLLFGTFARGTALRPYLDAAALAGLLGLVTVAVGRATALIASGATDNPTLDAWLGGLFIVLALAAVGESKIEGRARSIAGQLLLGIGLAVVLFELAVLDSPLGTARAAVLLLLYCGVYVVGLVVYRPPFTLVVGWGSLALGAIVAIVAVARGAIDPLEWASAALAAALLLVGAVMLRRSATAGSWPWLAPGLFVLLLPSLFATFVDEPFLRLVTLGAACIVAIVVGAIGRLQAPLIIGAVVVLVHAIRTFAPQLVALYQLTQWWVWAVIGGAILLFLGLTFEKRVRDLRAAATRVGALR
ncbi:MAG: hypothetical protein ABJA94_04190 [Rhodoglobus sp.]